MGDKSTEGVGVMFLRGLPAVLGTGAQTLARKTLRATRAQSPA